MQTALKHLFARYNTRLMAVCIVDASTTSAADDHVAAIYSAIAFDGEMVTRNRRAGLAAARGGRRPSSRSHPRPHEEDRDSGHQIKSASRYLTNAEAATFLRVTPKTLRNKVALGVFREGQHFFRRPGLGPRWCREALVAWVEGSERKVIEAFQLAQPGGKRIA